MTRASGTSPATRWTGTPAPPAENFRLNFTADVAGGLVPTPLDSPIPKGSLIYRRTLEGASDSPGDVDEYAVALDAGQTATVVYAPLQGGVELRASPLAVR